MKQQGEQNILELHISFLCGAVIPYDHILARNTSLFIENLKRKIVKFALFNKAISAKSRSGGFFKFAYAAFKPYRVTYV